jgi:PKD repeat protein
MTKASLLRLMTITILMSGACSISDQRAPDLAGPSELGLSLAITATPDLIAANGASQSVINIVARDSNGQPAANVEMRVDTVDGGGAIVETGILSARRITTGSNGQVSVTFTAPMETAFGVDCQCNVKVRVLPISTNSGSQWERFVMIRLVPPATIVVPGAPTPDFFFNPSQPRPGQDVVFDASRSFDSDGFIVSYRWEWGDADPAVTRPAATEDHDYASAGTYFVTLTVTDNAGQQSFVTKKIIVQ